MPTIHDQVQDIMKTAMKQKDKPTLQHARNLHAAIRKEEIDSQTKLDDSAVQVLISKLMKQRNESIASYQKGGRDDLVAEETAELKFLKNFMPEELGVEEIKKLIDEAVISVDAQGIRDLGKVMKALLPHVQGRADGKLVSQLVREKLS